MAVFLFAIVQSNLGGIQVQIVLVTQKNKKEICQYILFYVQQKKRKGKKRGMSWIVLASAWQSRN